VSGASPKRGEKRGRNGGFYDLREVMVRTGMLKGEMRIRILECGMGTRRTEEGRQRTPAFVKTTAGRDGRVGRGERLVRGVSEVG
jgi:hypothetical protein